jgi:5'-3' exoribonuclease 1
VSFYLNYLAESGGKLNDLDLGQPFEPFKQLLCILPKESCDLLPEPFQQYLRNPESPLRSPIDYYPDHFEDDLYGSVRAHEAVSLIPFLNHETVPFLLILDHSSLRYRH